MGIYAPDSAVVSFSNDGSTYSGDTETWGFDGYSTSGQAGTHIVEVDKEARFVRVAFYNDESWTFISDVSFSLAPARGTIFLVY